MAGFVVLEIDMGRRPGMPINYRGASGPVDFDQNGFVLGAMAHWVISNRHFVDEDLYDCTKGDPCPLFSP